MTHVLHGENLIIKYLCDDFGKNLKLIITLPIRIGYIVAIIITK